MRSAPSCAASRRPTSPARIFSSTAALIPARSSPHLGFLGSRISNHLKRGAYGVFLVTNFWETGTDERKQATAAVRAAKNAAVKHFIWSTLPDVEAISGGKFDVPHFTGKAKIDRIVKEAGFVHHTFVVAPFFYQNLAGAVAPQKRPDGTFGWALAIDPTVRAIHMGDITELGNIVAGAFAHPEEAGDGEYLPLVGDGMSFNEIVDTLYLFGL